MSRRRKNKHVPDRPKAPVKCDYCDREAERVSGKMIYPHRPDLFAKNFYLCRPCDAYVGCHPHTITPMGRLANASLRRAKLKAHQAFDPFWRGGGVSRREAYQWLADALGVSAANCHIGMFDEDMCRRVVVACHERALGNVQEPQS
ncbi:MAG: zinc-finger-containing protein [Pseudomonadota bacterium]